MPSGLQCVYGQESEFLSLGAAEFTDTAALSTNKFVVVYKDAADGNNGTAKIGQTSGTYISFGDEKEFRAGTVDFLAVSALYEDKFVIAYTDADDYNHGTVKAGSISGTTITFGSEAEYLSANGAAHNAIVAMTDSQFVVAYQDTSDAFKGKLRVGSVSGTTISLGSVQTFKSGSANFISLAKINDTQFIVAYRDNADSSHGTVKRGTISGTTVAFDAEAEFLSYNGAEYIDVTMINNDTFVVVYRDNYDANHGVAKLGTISGSTITFSAESEYVAANGVYYNAASTFDSPYFVVAYADHSDSGHGTAKVGVVKDGLISFYEESEFLSNGIAAYISIAVLNDEEFIVSYRDGADSKHGTSRLGHAEIKPTASIDLFIEGDEIDSFQASIDLFTFNSEIYAESGNCFTCGCETINNDIDLLIATLDSNSSGINLFMDGHESFSASGESFIIGHELCQSPLDLFTLFLKVPEPCSESVNLFTFHSEEHSASGECFTTGHETVYDNIDLTIYHSEPHIASCDLFGLGHEPYNASGNLFIYSASFAEEPEPEIRIINKLTIVGDYHPQIISSLSIFASSANIIVWNLTDGLNNIIDISNSGCYRIGDTRYWGWSSEYLPSMSGRSPAHYYYQMITDTSEISFGEFLLYTPEGVGSYGD